MRLVSFATVALILSGCGGTSDRVPVIGTVTLDGIPLPNVYVTFRPDDGEPGNGGFATTDADGRFEIAYPDVGAGLMPARYKVTVAPPLADKSDGPPSPSPISAKGLQYPPIYSSPENTPLRVTVTRDGQPVKVELSSQIAKGPKK